MRKTYAGVLAAMVSLSLSACSSGSSSTGTAVSTPTPTTTTATGTPSGAAPSTTAPSSPDATVANVKGDITVLTQRTDLIDTDLKAYAAAFKLKYPDVNVKFQGITNYEGEVRTRMNTSNYGDVLVIPNSITADTLATYFEPLGTVEEMGSKYRFVQEQAFDGKVYGIAITGNAQGIVYNKKLWKAAGITDLPKSPDEFVADLKKIKDSSPGVVPLYTNYKDGWPTTQWEGNRGVVSADPEFNNKLTEDDAPWTAGKDHYTIDKLLYDVVKQGLTEKDPTTTNWENSKKLIGTGKVSAMVLGSWAITQMQAAAASKDDIGYMPFPVQKDGKFHTIIGGDYKNAVSIHSQNKEAAKAWVTWFADESGYAAKEGGIAPLKDAPAPKTLDEFTANNVEFVELAPAPADKQGLLGKIDKESEIGLYDPTFPQRIIDAARGAKNESLDAIFADLNKKWAAARKTVAG